MPKLRTHYDNLKIARDASDPTIRSAYKALMQKYHPDKFDGSPQEALRISKIINVSYGILINPNKRAKHDRWINAQEAKLIKIKKNNPNAYKADVIRQNGFYKYEEHKFYTEKELHRKAADTIYSSRNKSKPRHKDNKFYYFGLSFIGSSFLFAIALIMRSPILMIVSGFLLLTQPVYMTYAFTSHLLKVFYGKRR